MAWRKGVRIRAVQPCPPPARCSIWTPLESASRKQRPQAAGNQQTQPPRGPPDRRKANRGGFRRNTRSPDPPAGLNAEEQGHAESAGSKGEQQAATVATRLGQQPAAGGLPIQPGISTPQGWPSP